mgnify:CR=1 FL=1
MKEEIPGGSRPLQTRGPADFERSLQTSTDVFLRVLRDWALGYFGPDGNNQPPLAGVTLDYELSQWEFRHAGHFPFITLEIIDAPTGLIVFAWILFDAPGGPVDSSAAQQAFGAMTTWIDKWLGPKHSNESVGFVEWTPHVRNDKDHAPLGSAPIDPAQRNWGFELDCLQLWTGNVFEVPAAFDHLSARIGSYAPLVVAKLHLSESSRREYELVSGDDKAILTLIRHGDRTTIQLVPVNSRPETPGGDAIHNYLSGHLWFAFREFETRTKQAQPTDHTAREAIPPRPTLSTKSSPLGRLPKNQAERLAALVAWENTPREERPPLSDWLSWYFGDNPNGPNVAPSTFHGWRRLKRKKS